MKDHWIFAFVVVVLLAIVGISSAVYIGFFALTHLEYTGLRLFLACWKPEALVIVCYIAIQLIGYVFEHR
jgi:hypothetical protein